MNKDKIMGLTEADIDHMQKIDAKVTAANQTARVALDHHSVTMQHLSGERDQFWVDIRERFELAPNQQFQIKNVEGFWQVLLIEEATEVEVPHND
jgi:hypothetical protein